MPAEQRLAWIQHWLEAGLQAIETLLAEHSSSVVFCHGDRPTIADICLVTQVTPAKVHLTGKEYGILELLNLRKGATVTKQMILDHLYGGFDEPELRIIDHFVANLRKSLLKRPDGNITSRPCGGAVTFSATRPIRRSYRHPQNHGRSAAGPPSLASVASGEIIVEEAAQRHQLSEEEIYTWRRSSPSRTSAR